MRAGPEALRLGLPSFAKEAAIQLPDSFGLDKVRIRSNQNGCGCNLAAAAPLRVPGRADWLRCDLAARYLS
jgi:hypothetical protein